MGGEGGGGEVQKNHARETGEKKIHAQRVAQKKMFLHKGKIFLQGKLFMTFLVVRP